MSGLSRKVRAYRLNRMLALMTGQGYDALAFSGADWFEWASNHPIRELAWERPFLLVCTASGRSFAFLAEQSRNHVAAELLRESLWIDDVTFFAEAPTKADGVWTARRWSEMVAEKFKTEGLNAARVGADTVPGPLARAAALLPKLRLQPVEETLRRLRWVKHEDEIAVMRTAAALSDWTIGAYREELRPGRLLTEVDYVVSARLVAEASQRHPGSDFSIAGLMTLSGTTSACPKGDGISNGKVLERDAIAVTTVATRFNGLAMEMARPWLVGKPDAKVIALFACAQATQAAAIEAAVAGNPVSGIHAAAQRIADRDGFGDHLRLRAGHGIGVAMHDFPEDVPFNDRLLLEHETYAIEPGFYIPGLGGCRFADTVAIGASAPEQLTKAPKDAAHLTLNGKSARDQSRTTKVWPAPPRALE